MKTQEVTVTPIVEAIQALNQAQEVAGAKVTIMTTTVMIDTAGTRIITEDCRRCKIREIRQIREEINQAIRSIICSIVQAQKTI